MFKIENTQRILNDIEETKSQQVTIRKKNERFLNISPSNFIKSVDKIYSKKALIPFSMIEMMDKNNKINARLEDLAKDLDYPKTSLSLAITEFRKGDFMKKERNGVYMINPLVSYRGSKYERDKLIKDYNKIEDKLREGE
ncbi:replication/maintenance protein RepL [Peptostreptococcus anaerobius]|uniref:replication/maintenance protein RepL n=1 Tax=Peptostreptococcus anaerobius TaxID=1261 RepID=UPI00232B0E91|nr:replication/maintenance protein RepL [Peptostreptococcus anaerobius]MDB8850308.1 replication/maintenance protein RepL [Peptostreptococcus anaerobius]MDB8854025.1 replication/maintenance protein RepL [Peptostreptococcus anaerobius]MDB8855846.1 replication/maintenance protein RepL [Peptostreptococcus anaerobius]